MTCASHIAVESFDVVAVGIQQVRRVVPGLVVAVARCAVRGKALCDTCRMKRVYLLSRPSMEAKVKVDRRWFALDHIEIREAHSPGSTRNLRDSESLEHSPIEMHTCVVVRGEKRGSIEPGDVGDSRSKTL